MFQKRVAFNLPAKGTIFILVERTLLTPSLVLDVYNVLMFSAQ